MPGMVVVAAAGNQGPGSYTIGAPGNSRRIITVGSRDSFIYTQTARQHFPAKDLPITVSASQISLPREPCHKLPQWCKALYCKKRHFHVCPYGSRCHRLVLRGPPGGHTKKNKIRLKQSSTDLLFPITSRAGDFFLFVIFYKCQIS